MASMWDRYPASSVSTRDMAHPDGSGTEVRRGSERGEVVVDWSLDPALLARLGWAALLGLCIGAERERAGHAAGVRTFGAVALGAAAFGLISTEGFRHGAAPSYLRLDPSRVASQVVVGVGFLGAGVLIRAGATVKNLTTAAALWATAAVGLAAGVGMASISGLAAALTLLVLGGVPAVMSGVQRITGQVRVRLRCQLVGDTPAELIEEVLRTHGLQSGASARSKRDGDAVLDTMVSAPNLAVLDEAIAALVARPEIRALDVVR